MIKRALASTLKGFRPGAQRALQAGRAFTRACAEHGPPLARRAMQRAMELGRAGKFAGAAIAGAALLGLSVLTPPEGARSTLSRTDAAAPDEAATAPETPVTSVPTPNEIRPAALTEASASKLPPEPLDVEYYWPATPQTVPVPTILREGPTTSARALGRADPGERLRINGRVDRFDGEWLRVRLASGRNGYFLGDTAPLSAYRARPRIVRVEPPEAELPLAAPPALGDLGSAVAPLQPVRAEPVRGAPLRAAPREARPAGEPAL